MPETIRSLEILTGGSPRLLTIVARFGAGLSFRELMADLLNLVDDHTEYFKGHIESLPAQERRVYLALADLWKPATTKEIADRARLETSKCSAQLARLIERGVCSGRGRYCPAQTVLPDRTPVQHLLPDAPLPRAGSPDRGSHPPDGVVLLAA